MNKIVIVYFMLVIYLYANQWNNLLHYSNNKNQIISNEFFLTDSINPTPKEELNATIEALKGTDGNIIACNFPARYIYLQQHNYQIPKYNLSQCKDLNIFLDSFNKDKVSLVFSSEYTNNPSSAFGHTMLLFTSNNKSIHIGDAVHFAAKTNRNDGFFKYSYNGFNGKYKGYFIREPFFKKIYEYNTLEQRYMYIYHLDFSKEQIKFLLYHLFELRKATFKYYFMHGNCATQTTDLLNVISGYNRKNNLYYLPIDTITQYKSHIVSKQKFIPLINKLNLLISQMTSKEKEIFYDVIKTNKNIDANYPDIVKEALLYYSTFKFRRFHLWYKNYDNIMQQKFIQQKVNDNSKDPLQKTQPSTIAMGIYHTNNENYLDFGYRPLFIDLFDIQFNTTQQSTVDTLTFDMIVNHDNVYLQRFDLVNIKSYATQNKFYKPLSWSLYSGINRDNTENNLKFNNEFGIGKTNNYFQIIKLNMMLNIGLDNSDIYIKPSIFSQIKLNNKSKIGINTYCKIYHKTTSYYNSLFFITIKNHNMIYQLKYNDNNLLFNVKYNF